MPWGKQNGQAEVSQDVGQSSGTARAGIAKKEASGDKVAGSRKDRKTAKNKSAEAAGRELIAPHGDKRYVRRINQGEFSESDDVGRSLSQDRKKKASRAAKSGQGDRGDQRSKKSSK